MKRIMAMFCLGTLIVCGACRRETKDEKIKRDYEMFTQKECPKLMDEWTRMDSICYDIGSRTLTEYYTVMGQLDADSLFADEELIGEFTEKMLASLKGSIKLKQYKDEGINFRYHYRSLSTGEVRLELTFTPEDYN